MSFSLISSAGFHQVSSLSENKCKINLQLRANTRPVSICEYISPINLSVDYSRVKVARGGRGVVLYL